MTHITCRLTAKIRDQLRNHTLGNRVWASFTFYPYWDTDCASENNHQSVLIPTFVFVRHKNFFWGGCFAPLACWGQLSLSATLVTPLSQLRSRFSPVPPLYPGPTVLESRRPVPAWSSARLGSSSVRLNREFFIARRRPPAGECASSTLARSLDAKSRKKSRTRRENARRKSWRKQFESSTVYGFTHLNVESHINESVVWTFNEPSDNCTVTLFLHCVEQAYPSTVHESSTVRNDS